MTNVFIGGSRAVSRLNSVIRERLDELIERNCAILLGDANGADKSVQQHFADRGYRHVTIYCMDRCRNNVGLWPTRQVSRPGATRNFAYYAMKDLAMTQDAKCGVMLWDGRSKGTLNNIQNLLSSGKKTLVYLGPERAFHKLCSMDDLSRILERCDPFAIANAQGEITQKLASARQLELRTTNS